MNPHWAPERKFV
jgi:hypothetical protein